MKKYIILLGILIFTGSVLKAQNISEISIDTSGNLLTIKPIMTFPYTTTAGAWYNTEGYMQKQLKSVIKDIPENIKNKLPKKKGFISIYFNSEGHIFECRFHIFKEDWVDLSSPEWIQLMQLFMQIKLDMTQIETEKDFSWNAFTCPLSKILE
ncbi:MAG: hypothetical protein ACLTSL_05670 [Odoribacter splanchnicus]